MFVVNPLGINRRVHKYAQLGIFYIKLFQITPLLHKKVFNIPVF